MQPDTSTVPWKGAARLCALLVVMMPCAAPAIVIEAGSFVTKVETLRDLTFASGSNLYVAPTPGERNSFATLAATLLGEDLVAADLQAAALDYDLVEFTDTDTGNVYHGLTEQLVGGDPTRGWGSFFVNFNAVTHPLIQVPHPRFDTNSWDIGARVFQQAESLGFLMAGAHRNANGPGTADVAHLTESIFQEVHQVWNGPGGENMPWSIHGFNEANYMFPAGTDVILSNGDGSLSLEVVALDAAFEDQGLLTFAYNTLPVMDPLNVAVNGVEDGTSFSALGGTTNVQGIYSRGIGGRFIHVEMGQSIRLDAGNRLLAADAITDAIMASEAVPEASTFALAAIGLAMLGVIAWHRRNGCLTRPPTAR